MSFTPRPYQQEAIDAAVSFFHDKKRNYNAIEILPTGCHAKGTGILMFDGSIKPVEDIVVGDQIMGPDSNERAVLNLCRGREMMYKITPHRGAEPFIVNRSHILHLVSTRERTARKSPSYQVGGEVTHISVADYLTKSKSWKHLRKLCRSETVHFPVNKTLPINPYMLGLILGDGCTMNGVISITSADQEVIDFVTSICATAKLKIRTEIKKDNKAVQLCIIKSEDVHDRTVENPLMHWMRFLGLAGKDSSAKFVPDAYKYSLSVVRAQTLAGLLDADGHLSRGGYDYISKSKKLADDVTFIARSLGLTASVAPCKKKSQNGTEGIYFRVNISGNTDVIPCQIARKKATARMQKKNNRLSGFTVVEMGVDDFYGFTLDRDHLYLTSDFMIHHNSGKSVVIANIAAALPGKTVVFQPSKEILEQNVRKFMSYGYRCGVYSASAGMKYMDTITFATIGSVARKKHLFREFNNVIIDECHLVNPEQGMYHDFIHSLDKVKVLGLTATPYRLSSDFEGARLKFLTRTRPKIFSKVLYYIQNDVLFNSGFLAKLEYYRFNVVDRTMLQTNSTGTEFTESSIRSYYRAINMPKQVVHYANRILAKRKNLLVFCSLISEANEASRGIPGSVVITGETDKATRERMLCDFTKGKIRCVINVGVLTTGFDYPELEAILIARSTMSLALYYQMVGRVMRPHANKESGWVVDLGGNIELFGKIETMQIQQNERGLYYISNNGRQLTNVTFQKVA